MLPPAIFAPAQFRAANAVAFVVNGSLGGFAFVFIAALEIVAGYSPVVAGSALVPVTFVTLLLPGTSGRLAERIGPRPPLLAGCLVCAVASLLAVRIGSHADGHAHLPEPVAQAPGDGGSGPVGAVERRAEVLVVLGTVGGDAGWCPSVFSLSDVRREPAAPVIALSLRAGTR